MSAAQKLPPSRAASAITLAGAVASAFLASACCIGPLVLGVLGLGGAAALVKLEPLRPLFTVFTVAALGAGFWLLSRKPRPAADGCGCALPRTNRAGRLLFVLVTLVVIGVWTFPYVVERLVG